MHRVTGGVEQGGMAVHHLDHDDESIICQCITQHNTASVRGVATAAGPTGPQQFEVQRLVSFRYCCNRAVFTQLLGSVVVRASDL